MKKYTSTIVNLSLFISLVLYMYLVSPNIGRPITLSGFFLLLVTTLVAFGYSFFGHMKNKKQRMIWSIVLSLYLSYLVALSSLNGLTSSNVSVATFVMVATLFMADRLKV